jgi:hypothetical protein
MVIIDKLSNPTPKQQKVLDRMSKTPVLKILLLAVTWLALFGITFVRGGGESDLSHMGVHKCSTRRGHGTRRIVCGYLRLQVVYGTPNPRNSSYGKLYQSICQLCYFVLIPV